MNKFIFKGRLSKDVDLRVTANNISVAKTSIAVNRKIKNDKGIYEADFFNVIAFNKLAEHLNKYFTKGQEILLEGRMQNRTWEDQEGVKRYATDYIIENVEFCGISKKEEKPLGEDDFITIGEDDGLPF